jgi:hypothetical protein
MSIEATTQKIQALSLDKKTERHPDDQQEEILRENTRRFCLFPIKYHEVRHPKIYSTCAISYLLYSDLAIL